MSVRRAYLLALLLGGGPPARAEAETLSEVLDLARSNAPRLRSNAARVEALRAQRDALRLQYLPTANAAVVATAGFGGAASGLNVRGLINSPYISHWAVGVEASWSALEFLRLAPREAVFGAEESALRAERALVERDVQLAALDAFERVLQIEANLRVLDGELRAREGQVEGVVVLVEAGRVAAVDLAALRAGRANVEAARALLEAERRGARALLAVLVGAPSLEASALVFDTPQASHGRPEEALAEARRAQASSLRAGAWREWLPRLMVVGSAGYANAPAGQPPGLWSFGVAVNVPLTAPLGEQRRLRAEASVAEALGHDAGADALSRLARAASLRALAAALEPALTAARASVVEADSAAAALETRLRGGLARAAEVESARGMAAQARGHHAAIEIRIAATRARITLLEGRAP